jgi:predicted nucleic acid-binding protein
VAVVVDSSLIVALANGGDQYHAEAVEWLSAVDEDLVTSPLVVAEADQLLRRYGGAPAGEAFCRDLAAGAYVVRWWADAMVETTAIAERHAATAAIGLVDASLVAVANRANTRRIASFRTALMRKLSTVSGDRFVLLPADAP